MPLPRCLGRPTLAAAVCVVMLAAPAYAAEGWVLVYRGDNKWVAQDDNKPLRQVLAQARKGTHHFVVRLPEEGRALSVERLEILKDLLAREASKGVVLEEIEGRPAKAGTLWVGVK